METGEMSLLSMVGGALAKWSFLSVVIREEVRGRIERGA
jgi:hypothetical protein